MFFELLKSSFVVFVFLLLISIIIIVHECGHYLFAKLFKVHVEEFAIGFGTKLYSFKRWGTQFSVRMIPLGGFVNIDQETPTSDYNKLKLYQKVLILFGGVFFNLIFAIILSFVYLNFQNGKVLIPNLQDYDFNSKETLVGELVNDIIVYPGDNSESAKFLKEVKSLSSFILLEQDGERSNLVFINKDDLNIIEKKEIPSKFEKFDKKVYKVNLDPSTNTALDFLSEGDFIKTINQVEFDSLDELNEFLSKNQGKLVQVHVIRNDNLVIQDVQIPFRSQKGNIVFFQEVNATEIVLGPSVYLLEYKSDLEGALSFLYDLVVFQLKVLANFIEQAIAIQSIEPLADSIGSLPSVADKTAQIIELGNFASLLLMMIGLNISVAILNMIPIPALDGGLIFLSFVEASFLGTFMSIRLKKFLNLISFIFLMFLGILLIFKDFVRLGTFDQISTLITRIFSG